MKVVEQNKMSSKANSSSEFKDRLNGSLTTISALIEKGNVELWPILEKLEAELMKIEQREMKLLLYR